MPITRFLKTETAHLAKLKLRKLGDRMELRIDWHKPLQLTKNKKMIIQESSIPEDVPKTPGIYFFSRRHGAEYLPFYIGETQNLRSRLVAHLKSLAIADVLRGTGGNNDIKQGTRYFHFGTLINKGGKQEQARLKSVQRHMIRRAVEKKIPILNKQLTTIKTIEFCFEGKPAGRGCFDSWSVSEA